MRSIGYQKVSDADVPFVLEFLDIPVKSVLHKIWRQDKIGGSSRSYDKKLQHMYLILGFCLILNHDHHPVCQRVSCVSGVSRACVLCVLRMGLVWFSCVLCIVCP